MRDFFYNKGDVLIAVLIIIAAIVVIYFRVGVVMGDPDPGERLKNFISPIISYITGDRGAEEAVTGEEGQGSITAEPEAPVQDEPTTTVPDSEGAVVTDEPVVEEDPPPPSAPDNAADITITINAGDVASTIADKLVAAGVISDKQAFLAEVDAQGAASKLKQGTFKIPAGSSISEIIAILVG